MADLIQEITDTMVVLDHAVPIAGVTSPNTPARPIKNDNPPGCAGYAGGGVAPVAVQSHEHYTTQVDIFISETTSKRIGDASLRSLVKAIGISDDMILAAKLAGGIGGTCGSRPFRRDYRMMTAATTRPTPLPLKRITDISLSKIFKSLCYTQTPLNR